MEEIIKEAGKAAGSGVAIESIPAPIPDIVEPPDNTVRNVGILVGVVALAIICKKLYCCTAKKK